MSLTASAARLRAGTALGTLVDGRLVISCPLLPACVQEDFVQCCFCSRTFAAARVSKHQDICQKVQGKRRPFFRSQQQRIGSLCAPDGADNDLLAAFYQELLTRRRSERARPSLLPPAQGRMLSRAGVQATPQQPGIGMLSQAELTRLQRRDLTPNDYELLLRLDEAVEKKDRKLSIADCEQLPRPEPSVQWEADTCGVCLAEFECDDEVRSLPCCSHIFHAYCITQWLTGTRAVCPLDKLEVKLDHLPIA